MTFSAAARRRHGPDVTGVLLGLVAAVAGAFLWALVAYASNHQFSFAAILMGVLVGMAIGAPRPGTMAAPVAGAILSVFGCAFGSFLAVIFLAVGRVGVTLGYVLGHLSVVLDVYPHAVGWLGFFLWAVAAFVGFRITLTRMRRPAAVPPPAPGWTPGYGTGPGYGAGSGYGTGPGYGQPGHGEPGSTPPPGQVPPPGYAGPGFAQPRDEPPPG